MPRSGQPLPIKLMLNELIDAIHAYLPDEDCTLIEKAYRFSSLAHTNQKRASGDTFFTHCLSVAEILAGIKIDTATIAAALLHDVLEDTAITPAQLTDEFGTEITTLVQGVTKISSYHFVDQEMAQAENWRKMLLAVTRDIRIILIKLADRLNNMRTISFLPPDKQKRIALESMNLYAPFAQRLGMYRWKSELEDLSFNVLQPDEYRCLHDAWEQREESHEHHLKDWIKLLEDVLSPYEIPFRLSARPKSLYGIYKKMERQHKAFPEIQDLIGLRLITDTVANCYALLGLVHTHWSPVENTFTDYISVPKINMYQSLHTSITGPGKVLAEIQIRTEEMHKRCEYGIAAHWRYKNHGAKIVSGVTTAEEIDQKLDWLRQVLEWQDELKDPQEFLSAIKTECTFEQVFVFTPQGKVIKLPEGATPVDFAYAVHSDIGDHCFGAKVGDKLVPLDYHFHSGEICEILTRKNVHPTKHWLEFAITAQARSRIRRFLRENEAKG